MITWKTKRKNIWIVIMLDFALNLTYHTIIINKVNFHYVIKG